MRRAATVDSGNAAPAPLRQSHSFPTRRRLTGAVATTGSSCAKAALAYAAGLREGQTNGSNPNAPFESPGYNCTQSHNDLVPRTVCTRGKEVFRLP
jgi:hypothetical protein